MAGLAIKLGGDTKPFEAAMKSAVGIAGQTAAQIGAKWAVTATGIDKVMANTARNVGVTFGREVASKLTPAALGIAGAVAGFLAIKMALDTVDEAAKAAQERLAELVKIAGDARSAGVGTSFLQSLTGQAKALGAEVGTLTAMLDNAREASTVRIGEGKDGASSAILDRLKQNALAGNIGQVDFDRFAGADSQEARIKVILDLLDQLRAKGANLAALDLARTMFGSDFETKLRTGTDMIGAMRRALDGVQTGDSRIIPPEEIQRAEALNKRIEEANRLLSEALGPIQRDIALWQQQQLAGWVDIKEGIASAAKTLSGFYESLTKVGQYMSRLGSADIFRSIVARLDSWGLIDKQEQARIERNLNGGLEATDKPGTPKDTDAGGPLQISVRPKTDTSRSLPSLKAPKIATPTPAEINQVETFVNGLEKTAAAVKAEADAYGKSNAERQIAIDLAKAEQIAKASGTVVTTEQTARIREGATALAEYRDKLQTLHENQEFVRSAGGDFLRDMRDDLQRGVTFVDALSNAFGRLATRLEDKVFDSFLDNLLGKSGGNSMGLLGSVLKSVGGVDFGSSAIGLGGWGGAKDGYVPKFADGGFPASVSPTGIVSGPGSDRSDSILARISTGEAIVNARATRQFRPVIEAMNKGTLRHFADGGLIEAHLAQQEAALDPRAAVSPAASLPNNGRGMVTEVYVTGGNETGATTTMGPRGPRTEITIDKAVAAALLNGSDTRAALKRLTGSRMAGG